MKKHNGMRPHDVIILIKIGITEGEWMMKNLATDLGISASEISESLARSVYGGLLSADKKRVMRHALIEFLEHGLRYAFPQKPGAFSNGIPTAYSARPLNNEIFSNEALVWPYAEGELRGLSVEPLHPKVPEACMKDEKLYEALALVEALRVGRVREKKLAILELKNRLK